MTRMRRVPMPREEIEAQLFRTLKLLRSSCASYDAGGEEHALTISCLLRLLLHDKRNQNPLLMQLGIRENSFVDTGLPRPVGNIIKECRLICMTTGEEPRYMPLINIGGGPFKPKNIPFFNWWTDPIYVDQTESLSRKDIVLNVAETDGGVHVDAELVENYVLFSREHALGYSFNYGKGEQFPAGRPELACLRQIAHEVFCSIQKNSEKFKDSAQPIIPELSKEGAMMATICDDIQPPGAPLWR